MKIAELLETTSSGSVATMAGQFFGTIKRDSSNQGVYSLPSRAKKTPKKKRA